LPRTIANFAVWAYLTSTICRYAAVGHPAVHTGSTGTAKQAIGKRIDTDPIAIEQFLLAAQIALPCTVADFPIRTWRTAKARVATVPDIGKQVHTFGVAFCEPRLAAELALPRVTNVTDTAYFTSTIYRQTTVVHTTVHIRIRTGSTGTAKYVIGKRIDTAPIAIEQFRFTAQLAYPRTVTHLTRVTSRTANTTVRPIFSCVYTHSTAIGESGLTAQFTCPQTAAHFTRVTSRTANTTVRPVCICIHTRSTAVGEPNLAAQFALASPVAQFTSVTHPTAIAAVGPVCIGVHAGIAAQGHIRWACNTAIIGNIF
jgi:hypothetical protein